MSSSLDSRTMVSGSRVEVNADPDCPNKRLQYRVVNVASSASSLPGFTEASYPFQFDLKRGKVLELKEGEDESLQFLETRQKLRIRQVPRRGYVEISLSSAGDLHLSRVQLEDPQKHRYRLGTVGTVNEKDKWYLPEDTAFSKKIERICWHVVLDKYSECLFDLSFDE